MKINILIPLAGKNTFQTNDKISFPRILNEINGKLLIEYAAKPFIDLEIEKTLTIAIPKKESDKYQLSKIVPLLGDGIKVCTINGNTKGAACSALLAIESLDLDSPLIISSFEQVLGFSIGKHINSFIEENVDAGVLTFEAIHPKWSFVKTDSNGYVVQAAEKMPISKRAIAGLYYFKTARLFIESAKSMIRKDIKTNDSFFISPTLNEIILKEGIVKSINIDKEKYFHINDDHSLDTFELFVTKDKLKSKILDKTMGYVSSFNNRNISEVVSYFSEHFKLTDPSVRLNGRNEVQLYIDNIFNTFDDVRFVSNRISVTDDNISIIEFVLNLGSKEFLGVDVIKWDESLQMIEMNAFLYEVFDE
ncbi:hypothetical protein K6U21_15580 [Vibrio vulnificus]|uniref:nuclear transport factor 2 family protein n=1 Tax=Vibrio vulnificus TaxID=672 RepID=UPI001EEA4DBB|nr:nuclear transport factor 2 family protein [Vibrio vulnificus]MCG6305580.1 hypothetical protein [Vibrio vulnificus]